MNEQTATYCPEIAGMNESVCHDAQQARAEERANARLIAAAPDLLDALKGLFEHCAMIHRVWGDGSNQKEADAAIAAGKAAIAKAEGEG